MLSLKGVVIEYVNAGGDTVVLDNGLVLNNIVQMPNSSYDPATTATNANTMAENEMVQMDVDDMIIEEPVSVPEPLPGKCNIFRVILLFSRRYNALSILPYYPLVVFIFSSICLVFYNWFMFQLS